jgi:AcrR family transcriptional regulator
MSEVKAEHDPTAEELSPRGRRKCEQIIDGAREVFRAEGFGGASVDEIARRAGISKATMYRYFPDKAAIFNAYVRRELARQAEHLLAMAPEDASLEAVLLAMARGYITFILSPFAQGIYRIAVAEAERFPDIGQAFFESGPDQARRRLAPVLAAAAERGELAVQDADVAAMQFFELCKAELFYRKLFCRECTVTEAGVEAQARLAVATFLKAHAPG